MANPLSTRRGCWIYAVLTWVLAMVGGVIVVGLIVHASAGEFLFMAGFLTLALAFWMWVLRRLTR